MAIELQNKLNTDAPNGEYPYGNIRDDSGAGNGTDIDTINHADFHQFFSRMMDKSATVYNGLPDNAYDGFQLFEAFEKFLLKYKEVRQHIGSVVLGADSFGNMEVLVGGGTQQFTLPPITSDDEGKRVTLMCAVSFPDVLTYISSGGDIIFEDPAIELTTFKAITFIVSQGNWLIEGGLIPLRRLMNPVFVQIVTKVYVAAGVGGITVVGYDANLASGDPHWDDDNLFNITNGRFTPPLGKYKVSFEVSYLPSSNPAPGTRIQLFILKNGAIFDAVIAKEMTGNVDGSIQFNNYGIEQKITTDFWSIMWDTNINITAGFSSFQLMIEAVNNIKM